MQPAVYRGKVEVYREGQMTVAQLEGYDYGAPVVIFHVQKDTRFCGKVQENAYVEVWYNGFFTRSLPPRATAHKVLLIASNAENIVIIGIVRSVQMQNDTYYIQLVPTGAAQTSAATPQDMVTLVVSPDAMEGILPEELIPGKSLCAVTRGMAALSLPPQYPVYALMPATP